MTEFFNVFKNSNIKINPAKIYPILKTMEEKGLVESEEGMNNNKKIKFYSITDKGLEVLDFIKSRWITLIHDDLWAEFFHDMTDTYPIEEGE